MKIKYRKCRPSPPKYAYDLCEVCPNRNGCSNCKESKKFVHEQKAKVLRNDKKNLDY